MSMLTVQYAMEYKNEGFTFLALSPGVSISPVLDILSTPNAFYSG